MATPFHFASLFHHVPVPCTDGPRSHTVVRREERGVSRRPKAWPLFDVHTTLRLPRVHEGCGRGDVERGEQEFIALRQVYLEKLQGIGGGDAGRKRKKSSMECPTRQLG